MKKYVVTNIRLPKEDLMEYRRMALNEGKSFSEYLRIILKQVTHQIKATGDINAKKMNITTKSNREAIRTLKAWSSGISDGAENHDGYIYR